MHIAIGALSLLAIMFGVLFVLEKMGKVADENHNIIPDSVEEIFKKAKSELEAFRQDVQMIKAEVHDVASEIKQAKQAIEETLRNHKAGNAKK